VKRLTKSGKTPKKVTQKPQKKDPKRVAQKAAKKAAKLNPANIIASKRRGSGAPLSVGYQDKSATFTDMKTISVKEARFLHDYVLLITFTNGVVRNVDFSNFLHAPSTPSYLKAYSDEANFKNFKVENGNVVWGRDWDLIFPIPELYSGKICIPSK